MDDEELRAGLARLLRAAAPVKVPPTSVIRRRMRRRQARQATAGLLACACVAVAAVLARGAAGPPPPAGGRGGVPACTSGQIEVRWLHAIRISGVFMETPPETVLLGLRNTGHAACALRGWPRLVMKRPPKHASITYARRSQVLLPPDGKRSIVRVIDPTWVMIRPGASAVSAVTIIWVPAQYGCVRTPWAVTPPVPGSAARVLPGGPRYVCFGISVTVSPVYPARVPISQDYPPSARKASPPAT